MRSVVVEVILIDVQDVLEMIETQKNQVVESPWGEEMYPGQWGLGVGAVKAGFECICVG